MHLRSCLTIAACIVGVAAPTHAGQTVEGTHLDRQAIVSLLHAQDIAALDTVYKKVQTNTGIDVLYRSLRLSMQPDRSNELALLETIPKTFDGYLKYRALDEPDFSPDEIAILSRIVDGYFERVARLAVKNHVDLRSYLVLHSFTDGYARTDSEVWLDWLLHHHRKALLSAFQTLDAKTKRGVCGDDCLEFEHE